MPQSQLLKSSLKLRPMRVPLPDFHLNLFQVAWPVLEELLQIGIWSLGKHRTSTLVIRYVQQIKRPLTRIGCNYPKIEDFKVFLSPRCSFKLGMEKREVLIPSRLNSISKREKEPASHLSGREYVEESIYIRDENKKWYSFQLVNSVCQYTQYSARNQGLFEKASETLRKWSETNTIRPQIKHLQTKRCFKRHVNVNFK